jgi:hypothetical protein
MTLEMSGRSRQSLVTVIACEPPCLLKWRHELLGRSRSPLVEETFTLAVRGSATRVRHVVVLGWAWIPWFLRPLAWMVLRFGRPVGKPFLARLRDLVESSSSQSPGG